VQTEQVSQQITPGRKIITFSKDEVKEIMLKAANEATLTKEEMYHRVRINVDDGKKYDGEWKFVLSVEEAPEN